MGAWHVIKHMWSNGLGQASGAAAAGPATPVTPDVLRLPAAPPPVEALARVRGCPYPLLLESALPLPAVGRYSYVAADPFLVLRARDGVVERITAAGRRRERGDPFAALATALAGAGAAALPGLPPFQGGAAGYLGYDLARHLERLPAAREDDLGLPDLCLGFYDVVAAWDHASGDAWILSSGLPAVGPARRERAAARRDWLAALLTAAGGAPWRGDVGGVAAPAAAGRHPVPALPGVRSTFSRDGYVAAVELVREYIAAGDIFQANLSQRLERPYAGDPLALYRASRLRNAAPFAAYFEAGGSAIVSASPERFLRLDGRAVETRPIKGTATRGRTPAEDDALARALLASEKDRAENVMIVDLLRNDLSRVCEDHSVRVPELCVVERYAGVQHLVSAVTGRLRSGLGAVDLLRAAFPGGSITGAPKIRALEIIAELEPTRRGVYTGALGWIGFDGGMDTSIAIRTMVVRSGMAYLQVGGGIVADSEPEQEYAETLAKAAGMLAALDGGDGPADR
jgi:para-aminobenzoate synthetase component I